MLRLIVAHHQDTGAVAEYVKLERDGYDSPEAFVAASRREAKRLRRRHGKGLAIFEGGAKSVESFFRMFPHLKLPGYDGCDVRDPTSRRADMSRIGRPPQTYLPPAISPYAPSGKDELMLATYNVENLFDVGGHARAKDGRWQPHGAFAWSEADLARKIANLGGAIRALNGSRGPDIVGLVEIESDKLLRRLRDEGLAGLGYRTAVHADWRLGLGTALLSRHPLIGEPRLHQPNPAARGVLEVVLDIGGEPLTVLVNHWPSRSKGPEGAVMRLETAQLAGRILAERLRDNPRRAVVALGDFNANPGESPIGPEGLGASADAEAVRRGAAPLYNTLAAPASQLAGRAVTSLAAVDAVQARCSTLLSSHQRPATGELTLFDQIMVSQSLLGGGALTWIDGSTQIARDETLLTRSGAPRRTLLDRDAGRLDRDGISDHLPVVARLRRARA